jgi:NADH:ubiquinone oxidoreductase subunit 6 (subunit J)
MNIVQILFYLLSFIVLASAVFVAATKNLVRSVFMFFITLFAIAGLYVLSLADFVAITQVVIYVYTGSTVFCSADIDDIQGRCE